MPDEEFDAVFWVQFVLRRMLGACTGTFTLKESWLSISQISALSKAVAVVLVATFCSLDLWLRLYLEPPTITRFEVFAEILE